MIPRLCICALFWLCSSTHYISVHYSKFALNIRSAFGWCFTHQYKNTTQFCFYAGLAATQNTNSLKASTFNARPEAKYYGYSIPFTTAATTIGDICDILGARNGYIMLDTAAPINPMQGYYTIVELRAYNAVIIATAKSRIGIWGGQATNTTWSGWTKL